MPRQSREGIDDGPDRAHVAAQEHGRNTLIARQLGFSRYLTTAEGAASGSSHETTVPFSDVSELWRAIGSSRLHVFSDVVLNEVQLTEWVPISPGLSTSDGARTYLNMIGRPIAHERTGLAQTVAVYSPDHKEAFLKAGYGCVRFGPHGFGGSADDLWLLGATTSDHAHDGFPVALTNDQYREVITQIRRTGKLRCTLAGELEWLPERFVGNTEPTYEYTRRHSAGLALWYSRLPRVYLRVREIQHCAPRRHEDPITADMVVSFIGNVNGHRNFYSAFVSFDPGRHESVQDANQWLRSAYIRDRYDGLAVTDCDEQFPSSDAGLSLQRVMSRQIDLAALYHAVYEVDDDDEGYLYSRERKIDFLRHAVALIGGSVELVLGDKYTVGTALAVGSQAVSIGGSITPEAVHSGIELTALAEDLAKLRSALSPPDPRHAIVYFALAEAENAARNGNLTEVGGPLARARDWILKHAERHQAYLALEAARRVSPYDLYE